MYFQSEFSSPAPNHEPQSMGTRFRPLDIELQGIGFMLKRFSTLSVTAMALSISSVAVAGEVEANPGLLAKPETAIPAAIASIIMFVLLVILLKKTAWGLIIQGLQDREVKIRSEIESAENARLQANAALEQYQKELAEARASANQMIQQARADAQKVADELRSKNEGELNSMKDRAKTEIEAAKRMALNEIYAETSMLATQVAGKILEREINPADQQKLVDEALSQLSSKEV